jgi:sirohydrochlorin ferrochelatase
VFLLATDLRPQDRAWREATTQADQVRQDCARILGFEPDVQVVAMPVPRESEPAASLRQAIEEAAGGGCEEIFVLPAALEFNLWQREMLGQLLAESRRRHPGVVFHHDDPDIADALIADALAAQVAAAMGSDPRRIGVLLAPNGCGDPASRAQSYRLMRLIWEQLGAVHGEVGFVRHAQPFLAHSLDRLAREPLDWIVVAQSQWETECVGYARVILENSGHDWRFADPPGADPRLTALLVRRATKLWREKRSREALRSLSPKRGPSASSTAAIGGGVIARVPDREAMRDVLRRVLPAAAPERVLVKVTWHGYATGTYTDPAALDLLLGALPAPAVILEGHTSSRNLGGAQFDWETEARENRTWIRQQEAEFLRRTGLADVLARHDAQYINVTEAFWDEEWPAERQTEFVPSALLPFRGCPMISFAKFKGPTRLGISNLFGLIPAPLRSAWHGPNITWFARICCDVARLYGSYFELVGLVEALFHAVRWNRQGLYRSRWGNYDLTSDAGYVTASRGLVAADILASRLQGQDVNRSAFFDVVRRELGWDRDAGDGPLPNGAQTIFT